jgi:gluconolactonase
MAEYTITSLLQLPFYTEGPAVDAAGNFYFTTLSGGTINRLRQDGAHETWAVAACPNGQLILPDGEHVVCDTKRAALSRFSEAGEWLGDVVKNNCAGVTFDTPNDLLADAAGNIYFTDSVRTRGKVYCILRNGEERLVAKDIDYANGLALSASEDVLFVAESYRNRILSIRLRQPGTAAGLPEVFATLPANPDGYNLPDGLALDAAGRVWIAHYGMQAVQVLDGKGRLITTIDTGMPLVSNLCFTEDAHGTHTILVTGGYAEPGPGALLQIKVTGL